MNNISFLIIIVVSGNAIRLLMTLTENSVQYQFKNTNHCRSGRQIMAVVIDFVREIIKVYVCDKVDHIVVSLGK